MKTKSSPPTAAPPAPPKPGVMATGRKPTRKLATDSLVLEIIPAIEASIDALPDSPHVRELRAKAKRYEQGVKQWATVPPSAAQREATRELVKALEDEVAEVSRGSTSTSRGKPIER